MRHIGGLRDVEAQYDGFIVDLWGVVHDGVAPYTAALDCLARLRGRPVLLLSNAPRRAASAQRMLQRMGVEDAFYTHILTSGEAVWMALRDRTDPGFARLGTCAYHLGPARDRNVLDGLGLTVVSDPAAASFVLNTGPDDDVADPRELATFVPELRACLDAALPMVCANPDLVVMRAGIRLLCAGTLAEWYSQHGGHVITLGKPDPAIYATARTHMAAARVLAIGDSLHTDIAGAAAANLDSAWILGGIHQHELTTCTAASLTNTRNLSPTYVMDQLAW